MMYFPLNQCVKTLPRYKNWQHRNSVITSKVELPSMATGLLPKVVFPYFLKRTSIHTLLYSQHSMLSCKDKTVVLFPLGSSLLIKAKIQNITQYSTAKADFP